ncbi:MAG: hypothetical protein M3R64_07505 [Pseudomonadota bacterium]|nr:hypothetical protein [Pseudomonadota bacterium]
MFDALTTWTRTMAAWTDLARTGVRASEMAGRSQDIVRRRTDLIETAIRTPWRGDYAELGRMVPEKLDAFGQSAMAVGGELLSMNLAFLTEAQHVTTLALRGRPLSPGDWSALTTRGMGYAMRTTERLAALGAKALAPVDAAVHDNARRLGKR